VVILKLTNCYLKEYGISLELLVTKGGGY